MGSPTILLDENTGNWTSGLEWTIRRSRGCVVRINNNTVANIGGQPKPGSPTEGTQIDTYNFETNTESRGVATMTNNITEVPHPPGFETSRFFRPAMATFDDDSIMVVAAQVFNDDGDYLLDEAWQYKVDEGWINLGNATPPTDGREQFAVYMLDNPNFPAYTSLNRCAF